MGGQTSGQTFSSAEQESLVTKLSMVEWMPVFGNPLDVHGLEQTYLREQPGVRYCRKKGNPTQIYVIPKEKRRELKCLACDTTACTTQVAHEIPSGPLAITSAKQMYLELVYYCPKCEKDPNTL